MGEVNAAQDVWEAKINFSGWHLRRVARIRLAKAKLATSPYNVIRATVEFTFIEPDFIPPGTRVDIDDYEGCIPDSELLPLVDDEAPAAQSAAPPLQPLHHLWLFRLRHLHILLQLQWPWRSCLSQHLPTDHLSSNLLYRLPMQRTSFG